MSKRIQGQHQQPTQDRQQRTINKTVKKQQRDVRLQFVQYVKILRINSKRMISTYCKLLKDLHFTNTKSLTISDTKNAKEWTCFVLCVCLCVVCVCVFVCASIVLPFCKVRDELNTTVESDANYTNECLSPEYPINVIYIRQSISFNS